MTLLFMDGCNHYATADLGKKYNSVGGTVSIVGSIGPRGGNCIRNTSTSPGFTKNFAANSSWVIGFRAKFSAINSKVLATLYDAGTAQCSLVLNADGTLSIVRGTGTAVTNGTSVAALSANTFYYIEWKVTIADSIASNSARVRVDGSVVVTVDAAQDLKATVASTATQVGFGSANGSYASTIHYICDIYVLNQSGSTNNDFLGDCRIDAIFPNADGTYSDFTPSTGTSHYALVDETTPNTSDYNSSATIGNRDSYQMTNLPALASQTVYGIQMLAAALRDDSGLRAAAPFNRSGSTNQEGATSTIGTGQTYLMGISETDPNTSTAWTESTVNAMELGLIIKAVP
jgi:hypothetical protein